MSRKKGSKNKSKFSDVLLQAAKDAGFTKEQIAKFTDAELLKQRVIKLKPGMAVRFMEKPVVEVREPVFMLEASSCFDIKILAGISSPASRAVKEQREITAEISRRGIRNIILINIMRHMKVDSHNIYHSNVTVQYEYEKEG